MAVNLGSSKVFSWLDRVVDLGEKHHKDEVPFSSNSGGTHTNMTYSLYHLVKVVSGSLLHRGVTIFPFPHLLEMSH